jgi:hypothetical protein
LTARLVASNDRFTNGVQVVPVFLSRAQNVPKTKVEGVKVVEIAGERKKRSSAGKID